MRYVNIDYSNLQEFEYETTLLDTNKNIVGTCELGKAEIQLLNDSNEYSSFKNQWIRTIHGSFYIYDVEPVQEKVNIKLSCYDIKYKLDTKYDSTLYTWPMTLKQWRNAIFNNCGVEYDNSDFPFSNMVLQQEPYIGNNPSNRNVICQIAQAGVSIIRTDSNDKFYFDWFNNIVHTIDDWNELTTESNATTPINVAVLGRGDVEDNVYYPEQLPENPKEFRIDNNYILDPQSTATNYDPRYNLVRTVYERVNGFSFVVFNMRTQFVDNKLSINLGNKVSYIDIWGNSLQSYVMTKKIKWLGGDFESDKNYEITMSSSEIKETSTDYSYGSSIQNDILEVSRKADKNAGIIEDVIRKQINLSIGGNNLLPNTKEFTDITVGQATLADERYRDLAVRHYDNSESEDGYVELVRYNNMPKNFELGETYTLSFYAKGKTKAENKLNTYWYGADGYVKVASAINSQDKKTTAWDGNSKFTLSDAWERYWVTYTLENDGDTSIEKHILFRLYAGEEVSLCGLKFEKGNIATDWSPNPNDIENYLEENYSTKIDANNDYVEIMGKFNGYVPTSEMLEIEKNVTKLQTDTYTKTEINTKLTDGSVTKVQTTSGTFSEDGMVYEKTNAPTKTTINEVGVGTKKTNSSDYVLFAGYVDDNNTQYADYKGQTIVASENMLVKNYLVVGKHSRYEDYTDEEGNECTAEFLI